MSMKYFCDRCEKEIKHPREHGLKYHRRGESTDYVALCKKCYEAVTAFVKGDL